MSPFHDVAPATPPHQFPLLTIGWATNPEGEARMQKERIERIWMRGRGAEALDDAIYEFRGRPGGLAIDTDLRIFGHTQRDILAKASELHKAGIRIIDIDRPTADPHELVHRALRALHASQPIRNHRTARRRGRTGGLAKAANEAIRRAGLISDDIAIRLCASRLHWKEKAEILGMPISTIQRHYGV